MYFDETKPDVVVNILGTDYEIYMNVPTTADKTLERCEGYCDKTTKRLVIGKLGNECNLGEPMEYIKYVVRHEVIHAFLFESGIGGDTVWDIDGQEHPEHMVEWFGMQFPKIAAVYETLGVM